MKAKLKAALPLGWALAKFLWQNRKVELAVGGTVVTLTAELVRVLVGHP